VRITGGQIVCGSAMAAVQHSYRDSGPLAEKKCGSRCISRRQLRISQRRQRKQLRPSSGVCDDNSRTGSHIWRSRLPPSCATNPACQYRQANALLGGIEVMEVKRRRVAFATVNARQGRLVFAQELAYVRLPSSSPCAHCGAIAVVPLAPIAANFVGVGLTPCRAAHRSTVAHPF
jgi:hypothetical protein